MMIKQARKHKVQGGSSKSGLCMNIAYRNLGQFTCQKNNCVENGVCVWQYWIILISIT